MDLDKFWVRNRRLILVAIAVVVFVVASFVIWKVNDEDIDRTMFSVGAAAIGFLLALVLGDSKQIIEDIELIILNARDMIEEHPIDEILDESHRELIKSMRENSAVDVAELAQFIMRIWAEKIDKQN